jgi:hypothetical protein
MNELIKFGAGNGVSSTLKSGAQSVRVMNRAEFRVARKLTNAAAKREYPLYLAEQGRGLNSSVAKAIAAGEILVIGGNLQAGADKVSTLKFIRREHKALVVPVAKNPEVAKAVESAKASEDKLAKVLALLAARGVSADEIAAAVK